MNAVAEPVARRAGRELSFAWAASESPEYRWCCVITETETFKRRADRVTETRYAVEEVERFGRGEGVGRLFLFSKLDDDAPRSDEIYECFVSPDVHSCSCRGSACRNHGLVCRHAAAVRHGIEQGEI